jgi:hypothetical protein
VEEGQPPRFIIRFLILAIMDSFSHFLSMPDDTSNSERVVIRLGTLG